MISLEYFDKKSLLDFLESSRFKALTDIPINEMRGLSQIENPDASDKDILLIVAFENEKLAGYLGFLPTKFKADSQGASKTAWASCFWVHIDQRGKGVSKTLLEKGIDVWNKQVMLSSYVPATGKLYQSLGVFNAFSIAGLRLYIRADFATLLSPKHRVFQKYKTLISAFDSVANLIFDIRFKFKKPITNYSFEESQIISEELAEFIEKNRKNELFARDIHGLQWMLDKPWVRSGKLKSEIEEKYYFTSVSERFEFRPIIARDSNGNIVAYVIFALRDNHLKTPYVYSPLGGDKLAEIVFHFIRLWRVSTFTTFQKSLVEAMLNKRDLAYYAKGLNREFMIHQAVMSQIDWKAEALIQDGSGDSAFT